MAERKPLSKSTRFEVFKRDAFTCQYCGGKPPRVVLECDHILPVAEGGGDEDTNLITACFDCNRGKAARLLNVAPESLSDRAARLAEAEEQLAAYRFLMRQIEEREEDDIWEVVEALYGRVETTEARFQSIKQFLKKLDLFEVKEAAGIARDRCAYGDAARFKYFCGICWNKIRESGR